MFRISHFEHGQAPALADETKTLVMKKARAAWRGLSTREEKFR
jgi:hypothetical protein